ncbi:DUF1501 domain-containing protein [Thiolapillus sp.]
MKLSRRQFMRTTTLGSISLAIPRLLRAEPPRKNTDDIIISIFLRGAADGLNIIPPWGDPDYHQLRPTLAIPDPGEEGGALPLDDMFGLHPGMKSLLPLYEAGDLAIIHACGSPSPSHSHFQAQDLMERGLESTTQEYRGWLGRYLDYRRDDSFTVFHAVAMGLATPRTLVHQAPTISMSGIEEFSLKLPETEEDKIRELLLAFHEGDRPLDIASRETLSAVDELARANPLQYAPENGAEYPDTEFGHQMRTLGQLIRADLGLRAGSVNLGGWDTHEGEATTLDKLVPELSDTLAAFHRDMGDRMSGITLVVMTEFGRRAYENGSAGTDHGHAGFMMVLGKNVNGGRVFHDWPGLKKTDLYGAGDLQVTMDYRNVLGELISKRTNGMPMDLLFPDFRETSHSGIFR